MVNKFCPMCGGGNPTNWYVQKEKPYRWVYQCKNCRFVWVEQAFYQTKLEEFE